MQEKIELKKIGKYVRIGTEQDQSAVLVSCFMAKQMNGGCKNGKRRDII